MEGIELKAINYLDSCNEDYRKLAKERAVIINETQDASILNEVYKNLNDYIAARN